MLYQLSTIQSIFYQSSIILCMLYWSSHLCVRLIVQLPSSAVVCARCLSAGYLLPAARSLMQPLLPLSRLQLLEQLCGLDHAVPWNTRCHSYSDVTLVVMVSVTSELCGLDHAVPWNTRCHSYSDVTLVVMVSVTSELCGLDHAVPWNTHCPNNSDVLSVAMVIVTSRFTAPCSPLKNALP